MSSTPWYGLDGRPITHLEAQLLLPDMKARRLAQDTVRVNGSSVLVSTVFTVTDHRTTDGGPPVLWETTVHGGPFDGYVERHVSREQARQRHAEVVRRVRVELGDDGRADQPVP